MAPQQAMEVPPGAISFNGAGFGKKQKRTHDGGQGGNFMPQQQTIRVNPQEQGGTQFPHNKADGTTMAAHRDVEAVAEMDRQGEEHIQTPQSVF